jgi:P27 family predicted phage terminase small subunit
MGMARPRLPTETKRQRGTLQNCRLNPNEPQPAKGWPPIPAHLSADERRAFVMFCGTLEQAGILTAVDGHAVEALASVFVELHNARKALRKLPSPTYETTASSGDKMYRAHPLVAIVADCDRRYRGWLASVGLTPSDRSKVSAITPTTLDDPFAEFKH